MHDLGYLRPDSRASSRAGVRARLQARRGVVAMPLLATMILLSACGPRVPLPTRPAWESLPTGSPLRSRTLREEDAWLRHYVMFGEHAGALEAFQQGSPLAPGDRLLKALQEAVVLHEAGAYAQSNAVLEWAEVEAEQRYTRSVSRELASILVSDRVLAYTPPAGELAMVPYYRMLNYLALDDLDGALVESRKATALLSRLDRKPVERCHGDGIVQYMAGLVQQAAGEVNDALVSLRQAEQSLSECPGAPATAGTAVAEDLVRLARAAGVPEVADSIGIRYGVATADGAAAGGGTGDLLVLIENGFVAHRTQDALHIPVADGDLEDLDGDDEDGIARVAARISTDLLLAQDGSRGWSRRRAYRTSAWNDALDGAYILRLAWPTYRLESNAPREVRIAVGDVVAQPVELGNISLVMRQELTDERPAMLARLVLRGLTKYLVTREVEERTEEKHGEAAGFLLGRLANIAGNYMEQADTRSWSLLPDRISLLRLRLPAGSHHVRVEVIGESGQARTHDLGEVVIEAGRLAVLRERVWSRDAEARWEEEFDPVDLLRESPAEAEQLTGHDQQMVPEALPPVATDSARTPES